MHILAITEQGTALNVEGETLLLSRGQKVMRRVRLAEINQVLLFGRVEISSGAIAALARRQVDVVFLTQRGNFRARLQGRYSPQAALRLAQLQRALEPEFCVRVARSLVAGKIVHQRQLLLRAQRRLRDADLADVLGRMRLLAEECPREQDLDRLRGREGMAAALYFGQFGKLMLADPGADAPRLAFNGRSRRPPRDPVNACLSFGYALLASMVETEVLRCGLDPLVGFFHQPLHGRPSLVLDLMEEFRPLVDSLVLRLVNRRQLGPLDFERRTGATLAEILADTPEEETSEVRGQESEVRGQESEVRGQESEVRGQEPEVRGQESEVRGQRSEVRGQRSEVRGQESEVRGQADHSPLTTHHSPLTTHHSPLSTDHSPAEGVYLGDTGRKVFLQEFFRRQRERMYYPPRRARLSGATLSASRPIIWRVIEGKQADYVAFVPG